MRFIAATTADQAFVFENTLRNLPEITGEADARWSWSDFLFSWEKTDNYILKINRECVGFIRWQQEESNLHLADLQIVKSFRDRSIGRACMDFFEKTAVAKKLTNTTVVVYKANSRAVGFYEKLGYNCIQEDKTRKMLKKKVADYK